MKKRVIPILFVCFFYFRLSAQLIVGQLLCDYRNNPLGVGILTPNLSWQFTGNGRGIKQIAYRVLVSDDSLLLSKGRGNIWDSGKMPSGRSIQVAMKGKALKPAAIYFWKLMVWDNKDRHSSWSRIAKWQMGLLEPKDWNGAKWIAYDRLPDSLLMVKGLADPGDRRWNAGKDILPLLRKEFVIRKKIQDATVFITGLGQFDCSLNGKKIGDHFLDPGWTKFDKHALYLTFDITNNLQQGKNALGVMLGNGFYFIPGERYHKIRTAYGYPKMICRILVRYTDGSSENIVSDESWKTAPGPVTFSSIYGGEDYNANLEQTGWNSPGFNDQTWKQAVITDGPSVLDAQSEEPLKILDQITVKAVTHPKPGVWIYDMAQNASAIPYLIVSGKKGSTVRMTPGELIDGKGLVTQSAVGEPVYFNYTLKGDTVESWHPQFMYYGFRYIQIEGANPEDQSGTDGLPIVKEIRSLHTRNSAATIGTFTCSNDLFNRIFKLIDWAIRSNTSSVFTDCPHREKLGWLEEAHLVGSSIHYNYDISTLVRKIIRDMAKAQTAEGLISDIAPEYAEFSEGFRDSPEWGSSSIILPYYMYQWYGDRQILEESYGMMNRYIEYLTNQTKDHILYTGLGDWYDIGPGGLGYSQLTPAGLTATAIYYHDLISLSQIASVLGKPTDASRFTNLAEQVRIRYNAVFFNRQTKQYGTGSQTSNAMSVYMGLVDTAYKNSVVENIVTDIRNHKNGVTSGDIGFRYLLRVLDQAGRSDVIFDMNSRTDVPGYGFQLAQGATALTESWQANRISSNNHFMLGHLMEWFYTGLGGINNAPDGIAFNKILIKPQPVGDIREAKATFLSPYGLISNEWSVSGNIFRMKTIIPVNTTAYIYLPAEKGDWLTEGDKPVVGRDGIQFVEYKDGRAVLKAGSGEYSFKVIHRKP